MASELLDLLGLLVDNAGGIGDVVVDELLVGLVDERCEEEDRGRDESKTPQWDDLNQIVGEEGTKECLMTVSMCSGNCWPGKLTATEAKTFSAKTMR